MNRTVIINATNLGRFLNGIAVYTLNIVRMLSRTPTDLSFLIYLNRNAVDHLKGIEFPQNCRLRWVHRWVSPDYRFPGHLLRLLYANYLRLKHPRSVIFGTSQLEAVFFGGKQIITIHDTIPLLFREYHRRQYPYFKYILPRALHSACCVITPSIHTKKLLKETYGLPENKLRAIYHGVPTPQFQQRDKGRFILYCGRIAPMKNLNCLLQAFSLIADEFDYSLIIAGNGDNVMLPPSVDPARVTVMPAVPEKQMAELFSRASLFVFPSLYEGFGLPSLEAMSFGCPVVVSNAGSLPEICGNAAYYVNPHSATSIAAGMRAVLSDATLRETLIRRGFERVSHYRWEDSIAAHLQVFEEAAGFPSPALALARKERYRKLL